MNRHYNNSDELCKAVAAESDTVILSFSCGKDSIGSWLQLRRYFKRIIPYYMYLIPDLDFVNKSIKYYEEFFETHIYQYPHPSLYRFIENGVFTPPDRVCKSPSFDIIPDYDGILYWLSQDLNLPESIYCATGIRQNDSLNRRASIKKWGSLNDKRMIFYPIYDWDKLKLISEMAKSRIKLPADYKIFGRTFDGLDYRFLKPIKDNFPGDYQKIIDCFPLADLEIFRQEMKLKYV